MGVVTGLEEAHLRPSDRAAHHLTAMPKRKGNSSIDSPTKARISRDFQLRGGEDTRGAASASARAFNVNPSSGPNQVKKYDRQIRDGEAKRRYKGSESSFTAGLANEIDAIFHAEDTTTYREAAAELEIPKSTVHRWMQHTSRLT